MTASPRQSPLRTAAAGLIGNVLEWFDYAAYGYFATTIGKHCFPDASETATRLKAFGIFALGFLARPLGSVVLGQVGDRIGRRALLTLSIALMGTATLGIGLLPTYQSIGVLSPILLVVFRLVQGFSLGGEFTGSMVYTTELASPRWRGLISSSTAAGTTLGFILGSGSAWLVAVSLGEADAAEWGWRIPFIASVGFVIIGYFLRRGIHEPEQGVKATQTRTSLVSSLIGNYLPIVQTFGIVALTNAAYYIGFTYAVDARKKESTDFLLANTLSLFVVLVAKPLGGWWSDRVGRRRLMLAITVVSMVVIYPALRVMTNGSPGEFFLGQTLLAIPLGMALGLQGAMVVEIFPLTNRITSMSLAYSVTLALSGGVAPFISELLVEWTDYALSPAFYIMIYGLLGLAIMVPMGETNERSLDD